MANTYSNLFHHFVFSTKGRADLIHRDIEERVWAYIGGIARQHELTAVQIGGIENHIHALTMSKPTHSPSQIAQWLKGESSKWMNETYGKFAWQDGYGVFSVSKSNVTDVVDYIKDQRQHHEKQTFEDEYVSLLRLHGVDYDERYVLD